MNKEETKGDEEDSLKKDKKHRSLSRGQNAPQIQQTPSAGDQMFQVNDEYDQLDELQCEDKHKIMVKRATRACN